MNTFKPFVDGTVSIDVATASERVGFTSQHNGSTVRLCNVGADLVFVKFGDSSVVATTDDIPVPGNWVELFTVPDGATHCAAIAPTSPATNVLYVTPGDGD